MKICRRLKMKIKVRTMKECPETCPYVRVSEDVGLTEDGKPTTFFTCENTNICQNLINHLRKQNKLKEED